MIRGNSTAHRYPAATACAYSKMASSFSSNEVPRGCCAARFSSTVEMISLRDSSSKRHIPNEKTSA
eukprot:40813-Chlamydomonas_euryale.AAC.1